MGEEQAGDREQEAWESKGGRKEAGRRRGGRGAGKRDGREPALLNAASKWWTESYCWMDAYSVWSLFMA